MKAIDYYYKGKYCELILLTLFPYLKMYYAKKLKITTLKNEINNYIVLCNKFLLNLIVFRLTFSKIICLIIFKELNPNFLLVLVNAFELKNFKML